MPKSPDTTAVRKQRGLTTIMARQDLDIGTPSNFRIRETMSGYVFRVLDRIAGRSPQDQDEDSLRRCRFLVANTLVIFVFPQFFLHKVYTLEGFMSPTAWVFVCGSGLGLALVKEIVQAHGGEVWVESKVGLGSTFFFSLLVPEKTSAQTLTQPPADRDQRACNTKNGATNPTRCQQESPKHGEDDLRQSNHQVLGNQSLPSGT